MRDFNWYADTAKAKNNLKSDRQLAQKLEMSQGAFHSLRHAKSYPSDETIIKLARLADVSPSVALVERSLWTASGEPKKAYASILQKLQTAALVVLLAVSGLSTVSTASFAAPALSNDNVDTIYYGKYNIIHRLKMLVLRFVKLSIL